MSDEPNGKSIVIADDHPLFRGALKQAVESAAPGHALIETQSLAEARSAIDAYGPSLVCLDLHMEDSDGFAGLIGLRHDYPALPVAIVSGSEAADVAQRAITFGASAFVPKSTEINDIRAAITAVLSGDQWTPPGAEYADHDEENDVAQKVASLTPTQLRVLIMVKKGLLNKQIAHEMSISEATVKAHLTSIFRKLEVQTRTQAVLAAGVLVAEAANPRDDA